MTTREMFLMVLIDLKKEQSPHLHLSEFNFLLRESVSEFIDSTYFAFEAQQKTLDYLRPLKTFISQTVFTEGEFPNSKKFTLPENYRHITGVEVFFKGKLNKCSEEEYYSTSPKRAEPDKRAMIQSNVWLTPSYKQPYWSIVNNDVFYIHHGKNEKFQLDRVLVDFIKKPEFYELTYSQAFEIEEDTSQTLEFTDEGSLKIKDFLVQKMMERDQNPRLQSYMQLNQLQPLADIVTNIQQ